MEVALGQRRYTVSLDSETMVTVLVCLVWAFALVGYSRGVIMRLPLLGDYTDLVQAMVYVVPMLLALPALVKRFCLADYLFFFACVFYYGWCFVAYPENAPYLEESAFACLLCVFPCYFIGRLTDIEKYYRLFLFLSVACIFMDLFYFLVYAPAHKNMEEVAGHDNMHRAYLSLPHVTMLLWATLRQFRLWKLAMTVLGVLFLLSCGTRGPLVCLFFFGFVYFLFFMNFRGAVYVKAVIVLLATLAIVFLREIALFLAQTFLGLNLSTRIMDKIVYGGLDDDTYRGDLRQILYSVLDKSENFFGLGLFGCKNYGVIYAHYLPLDFFSTFGYFVGSALMVLLAVLIGYALWLYKSTMSRVFIVLLCSLSIVKLMFSSTFVNEPLFFLLIGFCMKVILPPPSPNTQQPTPTTPQPSPLTDEVRE